MLDTKRSKGLKGKDLIIIGIFSAIYFIINFVFMLVTGFHPVIWILLPGFIALFTGIPFMIMAAKVQKPGAVLLMGFITGLIYFATGQFTLVILITFAVSCLLAEILRFITKYRSSGGNLLAFVFFSLGMTGSPLPIWLYRDSFLNQISELGMPADYVANLKLLTSTAMLAILFIAPVVGAVIGALIAKAMFSKHFEKAGIA